MILRAMSSGVPDMWFADMELVGYAEAEEASGLEYVDDTEDGQVRGTTKGSATTEAIQALSDSIKNGTFYTVKKETK